MYRQKFERNLILLLCVVSVVLGVVAVASAAGPAYLRPANPTMDYVPQNVGIYDTYYDKFNEPDCRACHGTSTAERHHGTQWALQGDCLHCHSVIPGIVPPQRDCKVCHNDGGPIGDLGFPHHNSDLADSDQCTACHDPNLLSETNSEPVPTYEPSSITPTPYSCENCHWPSGRVPHEAATYQGANNVAEFLSDWNSWNSLGLGPKPSTWPDGLAHPAPIEANGTVDTGVQLWDTFNLKPYASLWGDPGAGSSFNRSGVDMINKPYYPLSGTHHEVDGKVYWKCYNCHGTNPDADPTWNPLDPLLIRACENCHDIKTLHGISEHITTNDIYRVGGNAGQQVTANEKCVACHGDHLPTLPPKPAPTPQIDVMEPNFGSAGIVVSLTPTVPDGFGVQLMADRVLVGQQEVGPPATCSGIDYMEVPIYSWTENEVQFKIPGWTYDPGNLCVRVQKDTSGGVKKSSIQVFTLRKHPKITGLVPDHGPLSTTPIVINGEGFGVKQKQIYGNGYGYATYVELHASNDKYRVTKYPTPWTDTQIKIKLAQSFTTTPVNLNLLDLTTTPAPSKLIDPAQFYEGCWEVYVITDYFKDGLAANGKYLKLKTTDPILGPLGTIDPDDELLYREASDPTCFTASDTPFINAIKPSKPGSNLQIGKVRHGNTVALYGVNFGPTKQTSNVQICTTSACAVTTNAATTLWTNTVVKFKAPVATGTKWVRVNVPTAETPNSNPKKLIVY